MSAQTHEQLIEMGYEFMVYARIAKAESATNRDIIMGMQRSIVEANAETDRVRLAWKAEVDMMCRKLNLCDRWRTCPTPVGCQSDHK